MSRSEIYLAAEVGGNADARSVAVALEAALAAMPVACVVVEGTAQAPLTAAAAKPLLELVQRRGVAAFVSGDTGLARITKADGVHLPWSKDITQRFSAARVELGARYMIGADAGRSRHDAMLLGEGGADYVAFGIPPHVENRAVAEARQVELVDWWSKIFEIPCVAFDVAAIEQAAALAGAGADYISARLPSGINAADVHAFMASLAAATAAQEPVL